MASQQSTVDYLVDQLSEAGVSYKKMFGEYGMFMGVKMVAVLCDDELFVRPTKAGRAFIGDVVEGAPFPGAKPHFHIAGDLWEDRAWLSELFRVSEPEVSAPKKKKKP